MHETFRPLGVNISVPSLRVNEQLKSVAALIDPHHRNSLTLAPEVARDDMREQIRKKIKNEDLYEGCRAGVSQRLPAGEALFPVRAARRAGGRSGRHRGHGRDALPAIGREERGQLRQGHGQRVELRAQGPHALSMERHADARLFPLGPSAICATRRAIGSVQVKCHDVETSMLEGVLSRGDRRVARAVELAWRRGARLESWREHCTPELWWQALADSRRRRRGDAAPAVCRSATGCPGTTST